GGAFRRRAEGRAGEQDTVGAASHRGQFVGGSPDDFRRELTGLFGGREQVAAYAMLEDDVVEAQFPARRLEDGDVGLCRMQAADLEQGAPELVRAIVARRNAATPGGAGEWRSPGAAPSRQAV